MSDNDIKSIQVGSVLDYWDHISIVISKNDSRIILFDIDFKDIDYIYIPELRHIKYKLVKI